MRHWKHLKHRQHQWWKPDTEVVKKLRRKIFWSVELTAVAILLFIFAFINVSEIRSTQKQEWNMLQAVMDMSEGTGKEGHWHGKISYSIFEELDKGDIAVVELDEKGQVDSASGFIGDMEESAQENFVSRILALGKSSGTVSGMKYLLSEEEGLLVVDRDLISEDALRLLGISAAGFGAAFVLFGLLSWILSGKIVKPVDETIKSQKQFIADASHELKTPVAVMNANISILEKEIGPNKWLGYIKEEGRRMTALTGSLLELSRLEYGKGNAEERKLGDIDLSETVTAAALPFESVAFEQGKELDIQVPEGIHAKGCPEEIDQLVGILVDNAVRHARENSTIRITARKEAKRAGLKLQEAAAICVSNEGEDIPPEALPHIFDRFYKADASHKYEGENFGLGLAIAKSLAERNGGTIQAVSGGGKTEFTVFLNGR